jgi:hypothetical protein
MEAGTGTPIWNMVDSVTLTASLRDCPGGKFDDIVLATNSPWRLTASEVVMGSWRLTATWGR